MRAGRSPDGPKRPRYRIGYGRTGTRRHNTGARRHDTGGHDTGARGHDIGTCNRGARSHGAGDDPERPTGEEKEDGEDDAAAGDR